MHIREIIKCSFRNDCAKFRTLCSFVWNIFDCLLMKKSETGIHFFTPHLLWGNTSNRYCIITGKPLSEALIFASINPQYDDSRQIVHWITSSIHKTSKLKPGENMLCTKIVLNVKQFLYTTCSPQVWAWNFHVSDS